jgi:S-adenosylmethionine:tRNA ribosyltransferase-isomerase
VLLGAGDWRLPTEERGATPAVSMGEVIEAAGLAATVTAVEHPRLVELRFDAPHALVLAQLLRTGRPIQYSYLRAQLDPWDVHSGFGARPWAVEAPSAGRDLPWAVLRQVDVATVTEAAGISSTGDPALDARLPLPERYAIPAATVAAVGRARRVIAAGTSVVRALEGCVAEHGALVATEGVTDLRLGPGTALSVVDGLLTGMHEVGTSHDALARAVAGADAVGAVLAEAEARGMLGHEFGDLALFC